MSGIVTIKMKWTVLRKLRHYLFECPTFWRKKPAFECPLCQKQYRCYWDGHDAAGHINLCHKCAQEKADAAE